MYHLFYASTTSIHQLEGTRSYQLNVYTDGGYTTIVNVKKRQDKGQLKNNITTHDAPEKL